MQQTIPRTGFTFAVDDVTPATKPLDECKAHEAVRGFLRSDVESCCDYHGSVLRDVHAHPLLEAVHLAFSQHRPLVLTPDAVWVTIAQGIANHTAIHGERLRPRFVSHEGKLDLVYEVSGWVPGSPENPWPDAFQSWSGQVRGHVGPQVHDTLVCDFSTTGPVERAVSQVVMMDVFQRYFHYVLMCVCGIPTVTLEGTPTDWDRLRHKAEALRVFDIDWWLEHLLPVCDQFARASRGDVDLAHWRGICKLREDYGGDVINGWVCKLFPYIRAWWGDGPPTRRNPVFETGEGFQSPMAPPALSRAPFTWRDAETGTERYMEAVGGLLGVTQDAQTLALRPKVGWAVREAPKLDVLLKRLTAGHVTRKGVDVLKADAGGRPTESYLPQDLCAFYRQTDGADLFGQGKGAAFRVLPFAQVEPVDSNRGWHRIATLRDGSWLAINGSPELPKKHRGNPAFVDRYGFINIEPVCHCRRKAVGRPGKDPVVARSFTDLLERMLNSGGRTSWLDPGSSTLGKAEEFSGPGS